MKQKIDISLHVEIYGKRRKLTCKGWWAFCAENRDGMTETYLCPIWTHYPNAVRLAKEHFPNAEIIRLMPFYH